MGISRIGTRRSSANSSVGRRKIKLPQYLQENTFILFSKKTPKKLISKKLKKKNQISSIEISSTPDFSEKRIPGHYHLNNPQEIKKFCVDYSLIHQYPKTEPLVYRQTNIPALKRMQNKFKIAPVAILINEDTDDKVFGIFATRSIWVPPGTKIPLGHYLGEVLDVSQAPSDSSFVIEVLDQSKIIDAHKKRNWIPMINAALSDQAANVKMINLGSDRIEYYLDGGERGLFITSGTQMLVNYGSTAKYNDYEFKRYLNPSHSWLTTEEMYQHFSWLYQKSLKKLPVDFLALFSPSNDNYSYFAPVSSSVADCFDIPYLAYDSRSKKFISQGQQEYITALMLACWEGNLKRVNQLLAGGSNPNLQTNISGLSAFNVVIHAPIDNELKKELLESLSQKRSGRILCNEDGPILPTSKSHLFLDEKNALCWQNHASLTLQNKYENTILHDAIMAKNIYLVNYLLEKDRNFWLCQNENNYDPLEFAIIVGDVDTIKIVLEHIKYLPEDDTYTLLAYYSEKELNKLPRLAEVFEQFCNKFKTNPKKIDQIFKLLLDAFTPFASEGREKDWRKTCKSLNDIRLSYFVIFKAKNCTQFFAKKKQKPTIPMNRSKILNKK